MPAPLYSLAASIKARWDGLPYLVSLAGKLYTQEVPETDDGEEVELPYSWINIGPSKFDWTFINTYFEHTDIDFCLLVKRLETAEAAAAELRKNFDWKPLTFPSVQDRCLVISPEDFKLQKEFTTYKDGEPVYSVNVSYHVLVERQLFS